MMKSASKGTREEAKAKGADWQARLASAARDSARAFRRSLKQCRRTTNPEPVHALRVEARRLVVGCDLLIFLRAAEGSESTRRESKRLLRALARLRDTQVQREMLGSLPASLREVTRRIEGWLRQEEGRQRRRVRERCREIHPVRLTSGLREAMDSLSGLPRFSNNPDAFPAALGRWLDRLSRKALAALLHADPRRPETLHRLRISLKHLRYGYEAVRWGGTGKADAVRDGLRSAQGLLGEIQDAQVFLGRIREAAEKHPRRADSLAAVSRWLLRRQRERIRRFLARRSRWRQLILSAAVPLPLGGDTNASGSNRIRGRHGNS